MHRLHQFATFGVVVAALAFALWRPDGVAPQVMLAAAVIVLTIELWALASLPEQVTSLIFLLLTMLLAVVPPAVVFSGFASATVWLVLSGLVIAEAVTRPGLGRRIAGRLFARFTGSYGLSKISDILKRRTYCRNCAHSAQKSFLKVPRPPWEQAQATDSVL